MHQEQPAKESYEHKEYNLRPERVKPFMYLQFAVAKREIELHPEMTESEWVKAYSDDYRIFVDKNPDVIDRYQKASEIDDPEEKKNAIRSIADEVRQQMSH